MIIPVRTPTNSGCELAFSHILIDILRHQTSAVDSMTILQMPQVRRHWQTWASPFLLREGLLDFPGLTGRLSRARVSHSRWCLPITALGIQGGGR